MENLEAFGLGVLFACFLIGFAQLVLGLALLAWGLIAKIVRTVRPSASDPMPPAPEMTPAPPRHHANGNGNGNGRAYHS